MDRRHWRLRWVMAPADHVACTPDKKRISRPSSVQGSASQNGGLS